MLIRYINNLRWPALLLVSWVSLLVAGHGGGSYQAHEFAIDLKPGTITLPEFQVNMEGQYKIVLAVERNLPLDYINGRLGIQGGLHSPKPVVDIEWTLTSGNSVIASGSSRNEEGGGWGEYIYKTLGRFDGLPQTPYVLEVNILCDGSALAPANPRIAVWLGPDDLIGKVMIPQTIATFLTVITVIGILYLWDVMDLRCQENPDKDVQGDAPQAKN